MLNFLHWIFYRNIETVMFDSWDETKHSRDEKGRFTKNSKAVTIDNEKTMNHRKVMRSDWGKLPKMVFCSF